MPTKLNGEEQLVSVNDSIKRQVVVVSRLHVVIETEIVVNAVILDMNEIVNLTHGIVTEAAVAVAVDI